MKKWGVKLPILEMEHLHKLSRIHLHGIFVSSPPLSIYSTVLFIISMNSQIFILYFGLYSSITLLHKFFQLWSLETLWVGACAPLTNPQQYFDVVFSTSLFSGTTKCSRVILYISCSSTKFSHFSKEPGFLLLENGIRN